VGGVGTGHKECRTKHRVGFLFYNIALLIFIDKLTPICERTSLILSLRAQIGVKKIASTQSLVLQIIFKEHLNSFNKNTHT